MKLNSLCFCRDTKSCICWTSVRIFHCS